MKLTILNGARPGADPTNALCDWLADELAAGHNQARVWRLRDEQIAYCLGCFECWTKTPGICRIDDAARAVTASIIRSDVTVYVSPVTFGGYSSELKKALDRSICLVSPFFKRIDGEIHHHPRYDHYPVEYAIGVLPAPDPNQEEIFQRLFRRNTINLHAAGQASTVVYAQQDRDDIRRIVHDLVEPERVAA